MLLLGVFSYSVFKVAQCLRILGMSIIWQNIWDQSKINLQGNKQVHNLFAV